MKWARACGFGHSSFLMISKLWFSCVNTSTTEQEKRACSEVCWNWRKRDSRCVNLWMKQLGKVKRTFDHLYQLLYKSIAHREDHLLTIIPEGVMLTLRVWMVISSWGAIMTCNTHSRLTSIYSYLWNRMHFCIYSVWLTNNLGLKCLLCLEDF